MLHPSASEVLPCLIWKQLVSTTLYLLLWICVHYFSRTRLYLFNKLNESTPPTSKTATALLHRQLLVDRAILKLHYISDALSNKLTLYIYLLYFCPHSLNHAYFWQASQCKRIMSEENYGGKKSLLIIPTYMTHKQKHMECSCYPCVNMKIMSSVQTCDSNVY